MAANFWASSHCRRWLFEPDELERRKAQCRGRFHAREVTVLNDHLIQLTQLVGKQLQWRQPVIATAKLLYKRFFLKAKLDVFDPRLIMVTSMYLAAKIEELGQYRLSRLLDKVNRVVVEHKLGHFPQYSDQQVHDFEFHILEMLEFDLVVFHPYRYLVPYARDAGLPAACLQTAWDVVNDSYRSDAMLRYPPYLIALAAMYVSCAFTKTPAKAWFNRLNVRIAEIREIVDVILAMYADRCEHASANRNARRQVCGKVEAAFAEILKAQRIEHLERRRLQKKEQELEAAVKKEKETETNKDKDKANKEKRPAADIQVKKEDIQVKKEDEGRRREPEGKNVASQTSSSSNSNSSSSGGGAARPAGTRERPPPHQQQPNKRHKPA